ncbi:MAG: 3-isopropylmalate dehydratase large subunit [Myxococcota bacterium]
MASLTARILASHAVEAAAEGSAYVAVEPDLVLGHEATIALLIGRLRKAGRRVKHPSRCFFAADHFVPPATAERASILRQYLQFVDEEGIPTEQLFNGISHQLLVEDTRCRPGAFIAGADSHTTMGGALGAFSAGFGSTDILGLLATGKVWVKTPDAMAIRFTGQLGLHVTGKDVALEVMRQLGEGGGRYRAIEYYDADAGLTMAARMTLTNMAVDCGAKNGLFVPDVVTAAYMRERDGVEPEPFDPEPGDGYVEELHIDLAALQPVVARPGSPADVVPAASVEGEPVDQVFIGSCCGGRLEDMHQALAVLAGRSVKPGLRFVVTPASRRVYQAALEDGTVSRLVAAGAMVTTSSCGACGGIDKGILGPGEVCVSTSNRNFRGRMGDPDARIYLASAATAAAAALTGRVTAPASVTEGAE